MNDRIRGLDGLLEFCASRFRDGYVRCARVSLVRDPFHKAALDQGQQRAGHARRRQLEPMSQIHRSQPAAHDRSQFAQNHEVGETDAGQNGLDALAQQGIDSGYAQGDDDVFREHESHDT